MISHSKSDLSARDRKSIWHPYTQEKTSPLNIPIVKGKGTYLFSESGDKYIDAISSWWVNIHGHANPYISKRISEQLKDLEHVMFAGFTHPKAIELAERILKLLPSNQKKVFYSDDGSTAVEVALKMSLQYWYNRNSSPTLPGRNKRNKRVKILAFEGAYHGDTFGAMSVSGRSVFTRPFSSLLFDVIHLPFPDKNNELKCFKNIKAQINNHQSQISAFIYEPLVQGAAGMRTYNPGILNEIIYLCKKNNIITIADEVMTGFGRTGKMFASEFIREKPDIICLSKGITGGFLPFGLTSCTREIYNAFYAEEKTKTFFHGHSYTANPLACVAACANLDLFELKETWSAICMIEKMHLEFVKEIKNFPRIMAIRSIGTILAIELRTKNKSSYLNEMREEIYKFFLSRKVILRPLGNIFYIMPPYCISAQDLTIIYEAIKEFLNKKI